MRQAAKRPDRVADRNGCVKTHRFVVGRGPGATVTGGGGATADGGRSVIIIITRLRT